MSFSYRYSPNAGFVYLQDVTEEDSDLIYIANLKTTEIIALTGTGSAIWNVLQDEPTAVEKIVHDLAEAFEIEEDIISPDVLDFLENMTAQGLLEKM